MRQKLFAGVIRIRKWSLGRNNLSLQDLVRWTASFHAFIRSGLPIIPSLSMLARSEYVHNLHLRRVTQIILHHVENGATLTAAFETAQMPTAMLRLIRIAEETGELEYCLELLASLYKERLHWKRKIISMLTYPILLVGTSTVLLLCITQFVLPQFQSMYITMGIHVSGTTRMILFLVKDVLPSLVVFLVVLCCGVFVYWNFKKKDIGKLFQLIQAMERLPKLGSFIRLWMSISLVDLLSELLRGGIALFESLSILSNSNHQPVIAYMAKRMLERLMDGYTVESLVSDLPISTDLQIMLQTASRTGDLVACMTLALQMMREEWQFQIEFVTQRVQPVLIFLLGSIVCGVILVMILPLYDVMGHL